MPLLQVRGLEKYYGRRKVVDGVDFEVAVFTNVTRDHLDYHQTMEAYVAAKARLLDYVTADGAVIVNADDPSWNVLPDARRKVRFGMTAKADVSATDIRWTSRGSEWTLVGGSPCRRRTAPFL